MLCACILYVCFMLCPSCIICGLLIKRKLRWSRIDEQRQEQNVMLNTYCKNSINSEAENVFSCSDKRLLSLLSCSTLFQMQSLFHSQQFLIFFLSMKISSVVCFLSYITCYILRMPTCTQRCFWHFENSYSGFWWKIFF